MNKININGTVFTCSGGCITINNGELKVDGTVIHKASDNNLNVIIDGDVNRIECDGSVEVHGNSGNIRCGGNCEIDGNVKGDIYSGGSVDCGNVSGDINAGGSVRCRK